MFLSQEGLDAILCNFKSVKSIENRKRIVITGIMKRMGLSFLKNFCAQERGANGQPCAHTHSSSLYLLHSLSTAFKKVFGDNI